jgi:hypothetical protein
MPRRFTIVAATSFLLLLATAALWFDSIDTIRYVTYGMKGARSIGAGSEPGHASCWVWRSTRRGLHAYSMPRDNWADPGRDIDRAEKFTFAGFRWYHISPVEARNVDVPYWFLSAAFALAPLIWLTTFHRRRRRMREGCCRHCGYDLTGNASGVCPECGQALLSTDH